MLLQSGVSSKAVKGDGIAIVCHVFTLSYDIQEKRLSSSIWINE